MCGIAGIWTKSLDLLNDPSHLIQMRELLRHRGPDDQGIEIIREEGLGLVHTRLSIIDLTSSGHQPMFNSGKNLGLVFNGEIYNFQEIRQELEREFGYSFLSKTDTEVILKGYEAWGIDVLTRLNGMFAIGIWDRKQRRLFLARDRLGKKPLYYWWDPAKKIFIFASELKALLAWPFIKRKVSPEALQCYLSLGYVPAPQTMIEGIRKLEPGVWLYFDGKTIRSDRYWDIASQGTWEATTSEYRHEIQEKVEQAVRARLVSDAPLGAFLSGGIDSTTVVGLMRKLKEGSVRTYSAAFDIGPRSFKYNVDADTADIISQDWGTHHSRLNLKPNENLRENIQSIVWHMDEPHANPTLLTTYLLAQAVKKHGTTVILSGDGGDELFGGYPRYIFDRYVSWISRIPLSARKGLILLNDHVGFNGNRFSKLLKKAEIPPQTPLRYLTWYEQFKVKERSVLTGNEYNECLGAPEASIAAVLSRSFSNNNQDYLAYGDLALWIAEESNMRVDKMTMAHGVEVRSPFLDFLLVESAMSIPFNEKVGFNETKKLLKGTFSDLLPEVVMNRSKWGWFSPVFYWIKDYLWTDAQEIIKWLPETEIFSPAVSDLIVDYPSQHPQKIWALIIFGLWYKQFIACEQN